jgi:hypothetical protein
MTHCVTMRQVNPLMITGDAIAVYCKNHKKHESTKCGQNAEVLNVKACGTYEYM